MKQGTSHDSMKGKTEPKSTAVNPGGADNLGQAKGNHVDCNTFTPRITPLYAGRGYEAPAIGSTSHKSGSQGKY